MLLLMSRPRSAARGWHLSLNQCVRQAPVQGRSTDPEILRNVLAGVTVRLHPLRGGDVVGVVDLARPPELGAVGAG